MNKIQLIYDRWSFNNKKGKKKKIEYDSCIFIYVRKIYIKVHKI